MSLEIETVFRSRAHSRSRLLSAFRVLAAELRRYYRRRATAKALSHLNSQELRDIGLVRTETGYRELHHDRVGADYWN
ncbi:MAG: DUF1127 domain-containing protein [Roseibium sp.]|uniref:DUF1127 domain-containing protein n=1 Tax=Roseibium sp. TaxID=1936156 RepID=UPI0026328795|nr:DUF1127 domain-containing protein [Roseibium sp.]MCV0429160.1 DUF1127 domain-containing protein [Roseibium sp.]